MDLFQLSDILKENPELCSVFDYPAFCNYVELINLLRPKLEGLQASYRVGPPPTLSVNIHEFLKLCFSMSDYMGKLAWESFRTFAWNNRFHGEAEEHAAIVKHMALFLEHGLPWKLGAY